MQIVYRKTDDLIPYAKNSKKHDKEQIKNVARSIKKFGWTQPVVVDKENVVVIGHCRLEAAKMLKVEQVPCLAVENLSDGEIKALRIADNKLNESPWDFDLALAEIKELPLELQEITGFNLDFLVVENEKDDEIPEVRKETIAKPGDIFQLGRHRVMCGDSAVLADVEKLMDGKLADMVFTDPPYNTGMTGEGQGENTLWKGKGKKGKGRLNHMFDDAYEPEEWEEFLHEIFHNYFIATKGEAAFYVCIDWRRVSDIRTHMEATMKVSNVIVWDKMIHGLGSDYKYTYELVIVGKKGNPKINNRYGDEYQDVWHIQRKTGKNKDHATAKPVELCERGIKHASKEDDIVLDLFLGSGSTLIAAEKLRRVCYGMEMEPKYVDVIVRRWEEYTGEKAKKM